jgi:hypothetical protein
VNILRHFHKHIIRETKHLLTQNLMQQSHWFSKVPQDNLNGAWWRNEIWLKQPHNTRRQSTKGDRGILVQFDNGKDGQNQEIPCNLVSKTKELFILLK